MRLNIHKGQSVSEYAILLAIIVAVITGMQVYLKRGIQAGIKVCTDQIGEQKNYLKKDPLRGELEEAESTDIADGTTTLIYNNGTQVRFDSQAATKGEGSYSLYRGGFIEEKVYDGE